MTTLEDLRRTFDDHAGPVGDPLDLIRGARTGAARIRHRRRVVGAALTAAVVVLAAVTVPLAARIAADGVAPASASRPAGQVTITVDPESGIRLQTLSSFADLQDLRLEQPDPIPREGCPATDGTTAPSPRHCEFFTVAVQAYDPGAYDPTAARRGTAVTVAGVPGWFIDLPEVNPRQQLDATVALVWADPSGVWLVARTLTVNRIDERDLLRRVAAAIRIGKERPLAGPFQLGRVPDGLTVTSVSTEYASDRGMRDTKVEFGGPPERTENWGSGPPWPMLEINAMERNEFYRPTKESNGFAEVAPIAGNRTYWSPWGREKDGNGGVLWVDTEKCVFRLDTRDKDTYSEARLRLIVADLTLGDCTRPETWRPFLGG